MSKTCAVLDMATPKTATKISTSWPLHYLPTKTSKKHQHPCHMNQTIIKQYVRSCFLHKWWVSSNFPISFRFSLLFPPPGIPHRCCRWRCCDDGTANVRLDTTTGLGGKPLVCVASHAHRKPTEIIEIYKGFIMRFPISMSGCQICHICLYRLLCYIRIVVVLRCYVPIPSMTQTSCGPWIWHGIN